MKCTEFLIPNSYIQRYAVVPENSPHRCITQIYFKTMSRVKFQNTHQPIFWFCSGQITSFSKTVFI